MAGNKEAFQKAMNQGHTATWDQDWEKAASAYSAALKEFPTHPLALTSLGLALFNLQNLPASLACYKKAAAISPTDPIPQDKIARIYERMGRLNEAIPASLQAAELFLKARSVEKAIDNWLMVLSIQPENTNVRIRLAAVYERLGRREEAVEEYISTASIFQRGNKVDRAIQMIETAARIMPENQEIRLALNMVRNNQPLPRPNRPRGGTGPVRMAHIREMEGQAENAQAGQPDPLAEARQKAMVQLANLLFEQAEGSSTGSSTPRGRGLAALARGKIDLTGESGERNRITLHVSQAIDSLTQGDNQQATVELEHALNLGLRDPAAYYILGQLLASPEPEKAHKYLQQSVRHPEFNLGSYILIAQIYEKGQRWKDAATAYLQALALADTQVVPAEYAEELAAQYDAIIDSQVVMDDPQTLQATCRTVTGQLLQPGWRAYLARARQQLPPMADGMSPIPVAEMILETRGGQVVETLAHARQLAAGGKVRSALEEALYALQYAPNYLPLHILVGELLLQEQHTNEAVRKFMVVINLYMIRGEITRAVRLLRRVIQIQPTDLQLRQRLIELLVAQDKIEDALVEYNQLATQYYNLADLDKARQTYLDALKVAQKSADNRTWGANLLLKVADIDMQRLNLRQALRIYEQIRTIQPDNRAARSQIVSINLRLGQETAALKELDDFLHLLESTGHNHQAIDIINDLLLDNENNLNLRRRRADLYIRNHQIAEAIEDLDSLADAELSANNPPEAVRILEMIVSLNPPNVAEYRAALETLRRKIAS